MRVFAVAKALLEVVLEEKFLVQTCGLAHVCGNHHVILRGVGISLCREFQTGFLRGVAMFPDFIDDKAIVVRIADNCHGAPVLRCAAEH